MQQTKVMPLIEVDFLAAGGINDGSLANDALLQELLASYSSAPFILYFPAGTYHFTQSISLPSHCILRGASADSSILQFELREAGHLIEIKGEISTDTSYLFADAHKDDQFIRLRNPELFQEGDYLRLFEQDSALITSSWAHYSTGQLVKVIGVLKDSLFLDQALRRDFSVAKEARALKWQPKTQVGIERLQIKRLDATTNQTSNLFFKYANHCWVSCIKSLQCNFAHVELNHSSQIEVSGSHFQEAHSYGGGGKAYGIMLHFTSGSSLIRDNSFQTLRHALILQAGANGNVIAYNYSVDPYWTGVNLPYNAAGDLVLHGNYPYANLMEGNVVQNIVIDNSHGINGPNNTFFRNRADLYGIFMNQDPSTDQQNFLGNELTNTDLFFGNYILAGERHLERANNVRGTLLPADDTELTEKSLFLLAKSGDQQKPINLPPIGPPNALNTHKIEAQLRFEDNISTACAIPVLSTSIKNYMSLERDYDLISHPNQNRIELRAKASYSANHSLGLYSIQGQLVAESDTDFLAVGHLSRGLYIVRLSRPNGETLSQKWFKDWQ